MSSDWTGLAPPPRQPWSAALPCLDQLTTPLNLHTLPRLVGVARKALKMCVRCGLFVARNVSMARWARDRKHNDRRRVSDVVQSCRPLSTRPCCPSRFSLAPTTQSTYTQNPPQSPRCQALQDPKKIMALPKLAVGSLLECTRCSGGAATAFFFALGSVAAHAHVSGYSICPSAAGGLRSAFRHPGCGCAPTQAISQPTMANAMPEYIHTTLVFPFLLLPSMPLAQIPNPS